MVDLVETPIFGNALPRQHGAATLSERPISGGLWMVAPYQGREAELSTLLRAEIGFEVEMRSPMRISLHAKHSEWMLWRFGPGQWMLHGVEPPKNTPAIAAISDQSDAWVSLLLEGPTASDILARLTSIDLAPERFPPGSSARTFLAHANIQLLRHGVTRYQIFGFRSMAGWLRNEIEQAMRYMAARETVGANN